MGGWERKRRTYLERAIIAHTAYKTIFWSSSSSFSSSFFFFFPPPLEGEEWVGGWAPMSHVWWPSCVEWVGGWVGGWARVAVLRGVGGWVGGWVGESSSFFSLSLLVVLVMGVWRRRKGGER